MDKFLKKFFLKHISPGTFDVNVRQPFGNGDVYSCCLLGIAGVYHLDFFCVQKNKIEYTLLVLF